jgi:glycosyltransferase involved in cell wall biosynthesis
MKSGRSFLLIPNHSMAIEGDVVRIESAEAHLLCSVRPRFAIAGIAAFVEQDGNSSLAGSLPRSQALCHRLNPLAHSSKLAKGCNYLAVAGALPFILRRYQLLYIFCPGYAGLLAACWARLLRRPYGLYVRGTWLTSRSQTAWWWRWVFRGASFMIATGEPFRRKLSHYCRNVVNEVPLTELRPGTTGTAARSASAAPARLLFAGRLAQSKGIHDVMRALAILRREGREVRLTIAGGGMEAELRELEELRAALGLEGAVTLLGHVPARRLADAYRDSDLFVFPSYFSEGFPRVLYEAMMFSLAIVTCPMPGTDGFLVDGSNCLYCRPCDPHSVAACLRRLLDDAVLAARLGSRARADVESLYRSFTDASHAEQLLRFAGYP